MDMSEIPIIWTDYFLYRASERELDLVQMEKILRYSGERYLDTGTGSHIAIGSDKNHLHLVAYDLTEVGYEVITAHTTNRQQITFRLNSGRYSHETPEN